MADINAYLREAINGPAPQHKVAGRNQFEISEGSDGATHTKIVDVDGNPLSTFPVEDEAVKAELAEIKRTQAQILERMDETFDTRLIGSNVEEGIPVKSAGSILNNHLLLVNEVVPAGSLVWVNVDLNGSRLVLGLRTIERNLDFEVRYQPIMNGSDVGSTSENVVIKETNAYRGNGETQNLSDKARLYIYNTGEVDFTIDKFSIVEFL